MANPLHYSQDTTMRQDDRVTSVTFTLPANHKWTSVEEALKSAHNQEYELRMAFFWECQRLKAEVERLTKAGDRLAYCFRTAQYGPAEELIDALREWQEARNHG